MSLTFQVSDDLENNESPIESICDLCAVYQRGACVHPQRTIPYRPFGVKSCDLFFTRSLYYPPAQILDWLRQYYAMKKQYFKRAPVIDFKQWGSI